MAARQRSSGLARLRWGACLALLCGLVLACTWEISRKVTLVQPRLLLLLFEGFAAEDLSSLGAVAAPALAASCSPTAGLVSVLSGRSVDQHGWFSIQDGPCSGLDPELPLWTRALGWSSAAIWARPQLDAGGIGLERGFDRTLDSESRGARQSDSPERVLARGLELLGGTSAPELLALHLVCPAFPACPVLGEWVEKQELEALLGGAQASAARRLLALERPAGITPFSAALEAFGRRANQPERAALEAWQRRLWARTLVPGLATLSAGRAAAQGACIAVAGLSGPRTPPPAWMLDRDGEPTAALDCEPEQLAGLAVPTWIAGWSGAASAKPLGALGNGAAFAAPFERSATGLVRELSVALGAAAQFESQRRLERCLDLAPLATPRAMGLGQWVLLEADRGSLVGRDLRLDPSARFERLGLRWPEDLPRARATLRTLEGDNRLWSPALGTGQRLSWEFAPGAVFEFVPQCRGRALRLTLEPLEGSFPSDLPGRITGAIADAQRHACLWLPEIGELPVESAGLRVLRAADRSPLVEGDLERWPWVGLWLDSGAIRPPGPAIDSEGRLRLEGTGGRLCLGVPPGLEPASQPALALEGRAPRRDRLEFVVGLARAYTWGLAGGVGVYPGLEFDKAIDWKIPWGSAAAAHAPGFSPSLPWE